MLNDFFQIIGSICGIMIPLFFVIGSIVLLIVKVIEKMKSKNKR